MKFKLAGLTIYDDKKGPNGLKEDESAEFEKVFLLGVEEVENTISQLLKGKQVNDYVNYPVSIFAEVISKKGLISQNIALAVYYRVAAFYIYLIFGDKEKKDSISETFFNEGKIPGHFLKELEYAIINDEQINQYDFKYLQDWIKQSISIYTDYILGSFVKNDINKEVKDEIYQKGLMICEFISISIQRSPTWIALESLEKQKQKYY